MRVEHSHIWRVEHSHIAGEASNCQREQFF
jgi:hypothetical protein